VKFSTCKVALLCQESLQDLLSGLSESGNPQGFGVTQCSSKEMRIQWKDYFAGILVKNVEEFAV
jgi:hypothetical protein